MSLGIDPVVLGYSSGCWDFSIVPWAWTLEWPPLWCCAPPERCLVRLFVADAIGGSMCGTRRWGRCAWLWWCHTGRRPTGGYFPPTVVRCNTWQRRPHDSIINIHKDLAKRPDSLRLTWRCLNTLRTGYTFSKEQRKKWGYYDEGDTTENTALMLQCTHPWKQCIEQNRLVQKKNELG